MNEILNVLITGLLSAGGGAAIVGAFLKYKSDKEKEKNERLYNERKREDEETDKRIKLLQEIAEKTDKKHDEYEHKTEEKIKNLELKLAINDRDISRLERYNMQLIQLLIDCGLPREKIPERPVLERDKII